MMNNNTNEFFDEPYASYLSGRNPKVLKSAKGYDRARDRKNQRLYDYEYDIEDEEALNETYEDPQGVF